MLATTLGFSAVPVWGRIVEVGPRDLAEGLATVVRRDTGEKQQVAIGEVKARVEQLLEAIQGDMLAGAVARRDASIAEVSTLDEAVEAARTGFALVPFDLVRGDGEARLAADAVTVRCVQRADGSLPDDDDEPDLIAYVARSY